MTHQISEYPYDPLDYIVDKCAVTNATLTINSGTAIAGYNETGINFKMEVRSFPVVPRLARTGLFGFRRFRNNPWD